ncbi:hypothetical protein Cgig2_004076 [Carnegiea gigantea]|uniref:Uncharacterized protein n=1 Tax=Carnegiea gigantea TaxID=171969 RepID=A0A9Q1KQL2_9CARY|nr:hypothetical protein Cgig2_004076 [Carnegiea gigantea]
MTLLRSIAIFSHPIIAFLVASNLSFNGVGAISKQRELDYFVLSLQWPGTNCRETQKCCKTNACCRGSNAPMEFTLQKHGTCAYPVIKNEYDYFQTAVNLYLKYNVTKVLTEAGYVPSNSEKYPLGGIISAIENAFHMTPLVVCSDGAVEELRLCFYKDFKNYLMNVKTQFLISSQPRDCVTTSGIREVVGSSTSLCPKYVSLPTYGSAGEWSNPGGTQSLDPCFVCDSNLPLEEPLSPCCCKY